MKIAFITEYTKIGGGETNLLNLTEALAKVNDVTLFCSGALRVEAIARGIRTEEFATSKRWLSFIPLITFNKTIKRKLESFDVVHAYSINVLPILFGLSKPIVWTVHGFWEKPFGLRARIINMFVSKVICVSTDVYKIAEIDERKKEVIFLGTDFELSDLTKLKEYNQNEITLCCVARFQHIKGQDILVDALAKLTNTIDHRIKLLVVGDVNENNWQDKSFKQLVISKAESVENERLTISFEGFQRNVRAFIERADLVVVPSRYESFSMVTIEALACGKPVIVPEIGGPKDIVNTEKVGCFFKPGDSLSLAKCIESAIVNYGFFRSDLCMERARVFTVGAQSKSMQFVYEQVLHA